MEEKEIKDMLEKTGALLKGHFRLSSGAHSGDYLQCAKVLQYPKYATRMCSILAWRLRKVNPTCVVGPALGGIIVSHETAKALDVRAVFTERKDGKMVLRRGFDISPEDKVLIVEDVITTGLSTKEVIEVVKSKGAEIVGLGCIVDRTIEKIDFGVELVSLIKLDLPIYNSGSCPLCEKGIDLVKPGSR